MIEENSNRKRELLDPEVKCLSMKCSEPNVDPEMNVRLRNDRKCPDPYYPASEEI